MAFSTGVEGQLAGRDNPGPPGDGVPRRSPTTTEAAKAECLGRPGASPHDNFRFFAPGLAGDPGVCCEANQVVAQACAGCTLGQAVTSGTTAGTIDRVCADLTFETSTTTTTIFPAWCVMCIDPEYPPQQL